MANGFNLDNATSMITASMFEAMTPEGQAKQRINETVLSQVQSQAKFQNINSTVDFIDQHLPRVAKFVGKDSVEDVTSDDITKYLDHVKEMSKLINSIM